jgi:hypothetical protein
VALGAALAETLASLAAARHCRRWEELEEDEMEMVGGFCVLCVRWKSGVCGVLFMPEGERGGGNGGVASCVRSRWTGRIWGHGSQEGRSAGQEIQIPDWFAG